MSSEILSDEQRARIERNRENALRLRLQKQMEQRQPPVADLQNRPSIAQQFTSIRDQPSTIPANANVHRSSTSYSSRGNQSRARTGLKSKYWSKFTTDNDAPAQPPAKPVAKCVLRTDYYFDVVCPYHVEAIDVFRTIRNAKYNAPTKTWSFPLSSYRDLEAKMKKLTAISFEAFPKLIVDVFCIYFAGATPQKSEFDLSLIDGGLLSRLFPFQRDCINFAISKGGRVLIADDMGLGKTIEALGIMSYYRHDWPALIVCPASLRYTWKGAIMEWLPSIKENQIAVIDSSGSFNLLKDTKVVITIIGYSLMDQLKEDQYMDMIENKFNVVILDESHFIKNPDTKRTRACLRVLKNARRVILLSGTPALSRPKELYTQISAIKPRLFTGMGHFGMRYCDPQRVTIRKGMTFTSYDGASNMEELEALLKETMMIRRTKEDVLDQLPAKIRGIVLLDSKSLDIDKNLVARARFELQSATLKGVERHSCLMQFYAATGTAKLKAATEYVLDLLENDKKFLVFAHHRVMLDHLHSSIAQSNYDLIRIDGQTPAAERKNLCDRFQKEDNVRAALLSITAAGTGLTLTAANMVVFAELFWNPGILAQAEDRAHRVGQTDSVQIKYLVAQGTADDFIWPLIQKKLDILNQGGLSKGAFKTSEVTTMESANNDGGQSSIDDYLETLCNEELNGEGHVSVTTSTPRKKQRLD